MGSIQKGSVQCVMLILSFPVEQKNPKRKMHDDLDDDMDVEPTMKYKGRTTTFLKFNSILCMLIFLYYN